MKDTQKGRKSPSKGGMFKMAENQSEKAHVFRAGAKLVPNWCQNEGEVLVK